jgi:hypothetical protein
VRWVVALALAAAVVVVAAVAPAIANDDTVTARLYVGPAEGYFGQDCVMMPQVSVVALPKEKFEFQINNRGTWEKYEEQLVEETGTIDPLAIVFDDSIKYPAEFRVLYLKPSKDASGNAIFLERAASDTETIDIQRHSVSKTLITAPKTAKRGKAFNAAFRVTPLAGAGAIKMTVQRKVGSRWKSVKSVKLKSDESSEVSTSLKLATAGTYRISAKFAGNRWAPASATASKLVKVR